MIPVCEPLLAGKELEYVTDCIKTNWISSSGKYIPEFEKCFAEYCGCKHGISVCNGTAALHLALESLKIGKGDEVIVPAFTMMSSVFAIIYTGAKPVLVDSEPDTWNIDPGKIAEKVTKKTKAIMPVHIYGHPCDMDPIKEIAQDHDLYIIEDAAEAHGAEYKDKKTGGLSDIACFSFYANKIITTGEGGMVVTNDDVLAERAASLRNLAFSKERRFQHVDIGYNYRMTNIQAAIGLAQFERIEELIEKRRKNAKLYNSLLKDVAGLTLPVEKSYAKNVYWMYALTVDEMKYGMGRDELMKKLAEKGIETRAFFIPANKVNALGDKGLFRGESYPVAERLGEEGLYLPSGSGLKEEDIDYVCGMIDEIKKGV